MRILLGELEVRLAGNSPSSPVCTIITRLACPCASPTASLDQPWQQLQSPVPLCRQRRGGQPSGPVGQAASR